MDIDNVLYVFAVAFQIAGAVLLIIKYWGNTQKRIINEYFPGTGIANNDGNDNAVLEAKQVRNCVREIYASRAAFIFIAIGYALSIFGSRESMNNVVLLWRVLFATMAIIIAERLSARIISNLLYRKDIIVPYEDLPEHVAKTASIRDIKEMLNNQ